MASHPYDRAMAERIVSLVPTESGWRAFYGGDEEFDAESARIVAWALLEDDDGARRIVGMVVDGADQTAIVPAADGATELAPSFERYGFKGS
jgi:hypothetical protein